MEIEHFEKLTHHLQMIPFIVDTLIYKYTEGKAGSSVFNDLELEEELTVLSNSLSLKNLKEFEKELLYNLQDFNIEPKILVSCYLSNILENKINLIYNYIPCDDEEVALIYLYSNDRAEQISALRYILRKNNKKELPPKIFHAHSIIYYSESVYNDIIKFIYDKFLVMGHDLKDEYISNNMFFYSYDDNWNYESNILLSKYPHSPNKKLALSKELNTPEAKKLLDKAIEYNLLEDGYKWNSNLITKKELAYLCYVLSNKLGLSSLLNKTDEGRYKTNWKPFKELFNDNNLSNSLRGITTEDALTETMERIKEVYNF